MKSCLLVMAFVVLQTLNGAAQDKVQSGTSNAQPGVDQISNSKFSGISNIDAADTVVFDMSTAIYSADTIEFPVYFNSDDLIYSLDYSFKYDQTKMTFDTITLAPAGSALLAYSYYNPNDSVVRFTSSSLVSIANAAPIAMLRFILLPGQSLDSTDLFTLKGYLNGDACSEYIVPPLTTGLNENFEEELGFSLFPNPVNTELFVFVNADVVGEIIDESGRTIKNINLIANEKNSISFETLKESFYIIRIVSNKGMVSKRVIKID